MTNSLCSASWVYVNKLNPLKLMLYINIKNIKFLKLVSQDQRRGESEKIPAGCVGGMLETFH